MRQVHGGSSTALALRPQIAHARDVFARSRRRTLEQARHGAANHVEVLAAAGERAPELLDAEAPSKGTIRDCPAASALTFTRAASFATSRSETTRNMEAYSWA